MRRGGRCEISTRPHSLQHQGAPAATSVNAVERKEDTSVTASCVPPRSLVCLPALLSPHAYGKDLDGCSQTPTLTRLRLHAYSYTPPLVCAQPYGKDWRWPKNLPKDQWNQSKNLRPQQSNQVLPNELRNDLKAACTSS
jgi:hypothetical protein